MANFAFHLVFAGNSGIAGGVPAMMPALWPDDGSAS
jgi:hypothetical protein